MIWKDSGKGSTLFADLDIIYHPFVLGFVYRKVHGDSIWIFWKYIHKLRKLVREECNGI